MLIQSMSIETKQISLLSVLINWLIHFSSSCSFRLLAQVRCSSCFYHKSHSRTCKLFCVSMCVYEDVLQALAHTYIYIYIYIYRYKCKKMISFVKRREEKRRRRRRKKTKRRRRKKSQIHCDEKMSCERGARCQDHLAANVRQQLRRRHRQRHRREDEDADRRDHNDEWEKEERKDEE